MSGIEDLLKDAKGTVGFEIFTGTLSVETSKGNISERIKDLNDWKALLEYLIGKNQYKEAINEVINTVNTVREIQENFINNQIDSEDERKNALYNFYKGIENYKKKFGIRKALERDHNPKEYMINWILREVARSLGLEYDANKKVFYKKKEINISFSLPKDSLIPVKEDIIFNVSEKDCRRILVNYLRDIVDKILDKVINGKNLSNEEIAFLNYYRQATQKGSSPYEEMLKIAYDRSVLEAVGLDLNKISKKCISNATIYKVGPIEIHVKNVEIKENNDILEITGKEGSYVKAYVPVPKEIIEKIEEMVKDLPERIFL